jgi:hypothetical protein
LADIPPSAEGAVAGQFDHVLAGVGTRAGHHISTPHQLLARGRIDNARYRCAERSFEPSTARQARRVTRRYRSRPLIR